MAASVCKMLRIHEGKWLIFEKMWNCLTCTLCICYNKFVHIPVAFVDLCARCAKCVNCAEKKQAIVIYSKTAVPSEKYRMQKQLHNAEGSNFILSAWVCALHTDSERQAVI